MTQLKIGIAGAGIGGLAAAALLRDRGHDVTLFDQFDAPLPVGSGLVIQPVGQDVLRQCGALQKADALGGKITRMRGLEVETGRPVLDVTYGAEYGLTIHRSALFQSLHDAVVCRGIPIEMACRITGADNGRLSIQDRQTRSFDLIVDALGAGSSLSPLRARPLPFGAIWGTVDWPQTDLPQTELSQRYRRADRMIGILPIGKIPGETGNKAALFWSLPRGGAPEWRGRGLPAWRAEAIQLWPALAPFIGQITDPDQMTLAEYTHGTLRRPYGARLVHIGDAAHRASPQLGQGANMALLDASALAYALDRHPHHMDEALHSYALARRWHVWLYQAMSAAFTPQYQSHSRVLPVLRDRLLFPLSQMPPIPRVLTGLVAGRLLPPLGSLTARTSRSTPHSCR